MVAFSNRSAILSLDKEIPVIQSKKEPSKATVFLVIIKKGSSISWKISGEKSIFFSPVFFRRTVTRVTPPELVTSFFSVVRNLLVSSGEKNSSALTCCSVIKPAGGAGAAAAAAGAAVVAVVAPPPLLPRKTSEAAREIFLGPS